MKKKESDHYLKNSDLEAAAKEYLLAKQRLEKKNTKRNQQRYQDAANKFASMLMLLVNRVCRKFRFKYLDLDDQTQEGVMLLMEKVGNFDPSRAKIFNFCTTVLLNKFRGMYRDEKRKLAHLQPINEKMM